MPALPPLVEKALTDNGYDLISAGRDGWFHVRASGSPNAGLTLKPRGGGILLQAVDAQAAARLGLQPAPGMTNVVQLPQPRALYEALRLLHTLAAYPAATLSARVQARLAAIPVTERTREVRARIGQDVFREALMEFWGGRCALTGTKLPPGLMRASHAKPWAAATDDERLDPFNGLLLTVRYDALFDQGLIGFRDDGSLYIALALDEPSRRFLGLRPGMQLRHVLPGHLPYLRYHRSHVMQQWNEGQILARSRA